MKTVRDKVAAVTGAASGIGRALAIELARRGCHVAISDIEEEGLARTRDDAEAHGVKVTSEKLDVADREGVYAWADGVVQAHGRANIVINNAGVALNATVSEVEYKDFEWLMGINFWGVVYGTKAFLPHLASSGDGHVVNISSVFGMIGVPTQGTYNSAKFAVRGFTECLRQELKMADEGVSATCVHPGGIKTNIARAARMPGEAAERREKLANNFDKTARTTPQRAATDIIHGILRDRPRVLIGNDARLIDVVTRVLPTAYQEITRRLAERARRK